MDTPDTIHDRLRILEDYVYKLEREVSELTKEVLMWRMKDDPTYPHPDDPEPF